jgi:hypothetical protein
LLGCQPVFVLRERSVPLLRAAGGGSGVIVQGCRRSCCSQLLLAAPVGSGAPQLAALAAAKVCQHNSV